MNRDSKSDGVRPTLMCGWCGRSARTATAVCAWCVGVEVNLRRGYSDSDALDDGEWVLNPTTRVLVWQPDSPPDPPLELIEEIACQECGAGMTEHCRTKNGTRTAAHPGRKPRTCGCGNPLGWMKKLCAVCRDEREAERRKREQEAKRSRRSQGLAA